MSAIRVDGAIVLVAADRGELLDRIERVDLRVLTINVERQEVITRGNVTVNFDAIIFFRVVDAEKHQG